VILSLNLRTEHGCPGWFVLSKDEKTKPLTFRTNTNERVHAFMGNYGHDNELGNGFSVQKRAVNSPPWSFGKRLYLEASGMMMQAKDGKEYHIPIELGQSLVCVTLSCGGQLFSYIVVEPSRDERFRYWPVMLNI
jgi:hypothetical protein